MTMTATHPSPTDQAPTSGEELLRESVDHDYATVEHATVPLDRRRPRWHLGGLWTTFATGFAYIFLGTQIADGGYSLAAAIGIAVAGHLFYVAYALFASLLGSRTGHTHGLLTRATFGRVGTVLVAAIVVLAATGAAGFQAGLLGQAVGALFHWKTVEILSLVLGFVMIANNLFGFSGISTWARYVVTPVAILWVVYLVLKVVFTHHHLLSTVPHVGSSLPIWAAIGAIVGNDMWGNEPDVWRYGQPRFWWPLPAYAFAFFWSTVFIISGWCVALLAGSSDLAVQVRTLVHFSLFGAIPLGIVMIGVTQAATNDGNYYEATNVVQNLAGEARHWRRLYSCLLVAAFGVLFVWIVNYQFVNGWLKISGFLAVSVPCATTIMVVDYLLLPRLFGLRRDTDIVPKWSAMKETNVPALLALVVSVAYGSYAVGMFPSSIEPSGTYLGPAALESWVLAAVLYLLGVWLWLRRTDGAARLGLDAARPAEGAEVPVDVRQPEVRSA
jgi:purine-cytosine permease-like protein